MSLEAGEATGLASGELERLCQALRRDRANICLCPFERDCAIGEERGAATGARLPGMKAVGQFGALFEGHSSSLAAIAALFAAALLTRSW